MVDGCTIMWMYLMLLTVHLKMVNMVSFILHISYHNRNPYLQFWAPLKKPTYLGTRHFNLDTSVLRMELLKSYTRLDVLALWNHTHSVSGLQSFTGHQDRRVCKTSSFSHRLMGTSPKQKRTRGQVQRKSGVSTMVWDGTRVAAFEKIGMP